MNDLPSTNGPVRVTIRRIGLGPYIKWYALAFTVLGLIVAGISTAWYMLDGQLRGKAIVSYFLVIVLYYAVPGLMGSILFAVIYNALAGKFGGLQFDIVVENKTVPPPLTERWEGSLPKIKIPET